MSDSCQTKNDSLQFKARLKTWDFWKPLVFIAIGGLGGFLYYFYVGCTSGACGITSNPYSSIAFGGLFGYFIVNRPCAC